MKILNKKKLFSWIFKLKTTKIHKKKENIFFFYVFPNGKQMKILFWIVNFSFNFHEKKKQIYFHSSIENFLFLKTPLKALKKVLIFFVNFKFPKLIILIILIKNLKKFFFQLKFNNFINFY